jgi:hypothetical protein
LKRLMSVDGRAALLGALGIAASESELFKRFELQVSHPSADWPSASTRQLAVITGAPMSAVPEADDPSLGNALPDGRADGVVVMGGSVVAIESKLGNAVSPRQLEAHRKALSIKVKAVHSTTWDCVARAARDARKIVGSKTTDAFLLDQLLEYLQLNGYGGFTYDHFAYFALAADDRASMEDTKQGLRRALNGMMAEIRDGLGTPWDVDLGSVRKDAPGTYGALKPYWKKGGQPPHLSVDMNAAGIAIFANIETAPAYSRFMAAWRARPSELIEFLGVLEPEHGLVSDPPWQVLVQYRIPAGRPRAYRGETKLDLAVAFVSELGDNVMPLLDKAFAKGPQNTSPEIKLLRRYLAGRVIAEENFTAKLIADANSLKGFFEWLGMPMV